jgi:DNA modification methylase
MFEFVNDETLIADVKALFPQLLKPVAHARMLAAAKARYEELYPHTMKGAAQGLSAKRKAGYDLGPVAGVSFTDYLVHEAGNKRGWGRTSINDHLARATKIASEVLDAIEDQEGPFTAFNSQKHLDLLIGFGREYQMRELSRWAGLEVDEPDPPTPCSGSNVVSLFPQQSEVTGWWSDRVEEDSETRFCVAGLVDLGLGDSIELMETFEDERFDGIITDQPYGVDYRHGAIEGDEDPEPIAAASCPKMARILKRDAFAVLHGVFKRVARNREADMVWRYHLSAAGLPMDDLAIWDKMGPSQGGHLMHHNEQIWICAKGAPKAQVWTDHWNLTGRGVGALVSKDCDLWSIPRAKGEDDTGHPTPKPPALHMRQMVNFTPQGGLVLDPFMGAGTTAVAALRTGRRYVGIELERKWFEIAVRRVKLELSRMEAPEAVRRLAA